jgi:hypothetical protein
VILRRRTDILAAEAACEAADLRVVQARAELDAAELAQSDASDALAMLRCRIAKAGQTEEAISHLCTDSGENDPCSDDGRATYQHIGQDGDMGLGPYKCANHKCSACRPIA